MLSFLSGIKTYLIMAGIFVLLVTAFIFYYKYNQNQLAQLNQTIAKQQLALDTEAATIKKLNDAIVNTQLASDALNAKFTTIEKDTSQLTKEFSSHDLATIANKKPGILEDLVNNATKKTLTQFETISQPGA